MTQKNKRMYSLILENPGTQKLALVKAIKEITGYGLKESKDIVDDYPSEVYTFTSKNNASMAAQKLNKIDFGVKTRVVDKEKNPDFSENEIEVESNYFVETPPDIPPTHSKEIYIQYSSNKYIGTYNLHKKKYYVGTSELDTSRITFWLKPL